MAKGGRRVPSGAGTALEPIKAVTMDHSPSLGIGVVRGRAL